MKFRTVFLIATLIGIASSLLAQNPQSTLAPIVATNAKYANGVAPGYAPTSGTALVLNLGPGTANCAGTIETYAGGTLSMSVSTVNYVYLNTAASCAPAVKNSSFTVSDVPIAIVTTNGVSILQTCNNNGTSSPAGSYPCIVDDRTIFNAPGLVCLSGDVSAGSGGSCTSAILATVNSAPGSCGDSTHVCQVTTNGKGLVTSQTAVSISGAGGTVNVNGSPVTSPNFNATTPAAGSGNQNCTWQVSGSDISCYVAVNSGGGSTVPNSTVSEGGGAFFGGDSPSYAGFDTTGCTGGSVICNAVGELVKTAYGGLGKVWPIEYPSYPTPPAGYSTWGNAFYPDCINMQLLPQVAQGDSSYVDVYMQCADGWWGGIGFGTITNQAAAYQASINVTAAWGGSLKYQQIWASNGSSCVASGSGSWTADNSFASGVALQTTSTGAVLTCTTPYAVANSVIGVFKVVSGGTATATFAIDGATADTWSAGAAGTIATTPGSTSFWWGNLYPLSATPASHTYTVTVTSASGGEPFTVVMFASPPTSQNWNGLGAPRVFIAGTQIDNGSTYNTQTQTYVAALVADGWSNIFFHNLWNDWPDDTIPFAGGTYPNGRVCPASTVGSPHPGDCGHLFWSWGYLTAAGKFPVTSAGPRVTATAPVTVSVANGAANVACPACARTDQPNGLTGLQTIQTASSTTKAIVVRGSAGSINTPAFLLAFNTGASTTQTLTTGATVIAACGYGPETVTSTLNAGAWTLEATFSGANSGVIWIASNVTGGSDTISVSNGGDCDFQEWSNLQPSSPLDGSILNILVTTIGATSQIAPALSTTQANDLIIVGAVGNGHFGGAPNPVSASGYSNCSTGAIYAGFCSQVASGTGTFQPTLNFDSGFVTSSSQGPVFILALKASSSGTQTADLVQNQTSAGGVVSGVSGNGYPYIIPVHFAALPSSPVAGQPATIDDAAGTPAWHGTASGTGTGSAATTYGVFYNGANWVYAQ